jgi:hypothetical protein
MQRWVLVSAVVLTFAPEVSAQPQPPIPPDLPVVVVRGEGIVRMAPDRALVRVGAESRAREPKEAQTSNAAAMSAVLQKIAGAGIPKDAVRTLVVSLQQEFDYSGGKQTPRGYLARNIVEVRVDDLARLGEVLDASVSSGATTIQSLSFDLKDRTKFEREALTLAVADATSRADAAASGARRTVDRVIRIDEVVGPVIRPSQSAAFRVSADAAAASSTPVTEGEIEIRAEVTLTAVIK